MKEAVSEADERSSVWSPISGLGVLSGRCWCMVLGVLGGRRGELGPGQQMGSESRGHTGGLKCWGKEKGQVSRLTFPREARPRAGARPANQVWTRPKGARGQPTAEGREGFTNLG